MEGIFATITYAISAIQDLAACTENMAGKPMSLATVGFGGQVVDSSASLCTYEAEYLGLFHGPALESMCPP